MFPLKNTLSGALAGNILFGGFIGLGVDAVSGRGGGYQDAVKVVLELGSGTVDLGKAGAAPAASAGAQGANGSASSSGGAPDKAASAKTTGYD
jgi:hypothetical protein